MLARGRGQIRGGKEGWEWKIKASGAMGTEMRCQKKFKIKRKSIVHIWSATQMLQQLLL